MENIDIDKYIESLKKCKTFQDVEEAHWERCKLWFEAFKRKDWEYLEEEIQKCEPTPELKKGIKFMFSHLGLFSCCSGSEYEEHFNFINRMLATDE